MITLNASPPPLAASAALFLDFDGTLAPIAPRPHEVQVPPWVVPTLRALGQHLQGALAIVSGRPVVEIDRFLAPLRLPVAGAHGAQWRATAAGDVVFLGSPPPAGLLARASALAARHAGLLLEPKPSGFSLHYRARPELEADCRDALSKALAAEPGAAAEWELLHGQFVFELKQRAVSKGTAVQALLRLPAFMGRQPVFIGDDTTDEDGIAAAQAAGGYGVRIGPGESRAQFRLAEPATLGSWLGAALPTAPAAASQDESA